MADGSAIQWTDATWSPVTGCDRVSPGCDHCYALTMAKRLKAMGQAKYQRDGDPRTSGPGFGLTVHPDALMLPLRWRKPRKVFVNSMSDLFHADVPDGFIGSVFDVMAQTPQHTYQILTKRHARMRSLLNRWADDGWTWRRHDGLWCGPVKGPLENVHVGVSAENQKWFDIRVPALMETPATVRFVSAEPLIGRIDMAFDHECGDPPHMYCPPVPDWVIVGGESGPGARPMELAWVREIVEQCRWSGIAPFVKQLGTVLGQQYEAGPHGADWDRWPEDLKVREFPRIAEAVTA